MSSRKRNEWWKRERNQHRRTRPDGVMPATSVTGRRASIPLHELMGGRLLGSAFPEEADDDRELLFGLLKMANYLERHGGGRD